MKDAVIGIDLCGIFTKFGIISMEGDILVESAVHTDLTDDFNIYISSLINAIDKTLVEIGNSVSIKGIGIGAPNANYKRGSIEFAPNLKWARNKVVYLAVPLQEHFRVPVVTTNNANAAAIGEMIYGNAKGVKNFFLVNLGMGLGSGIVVNGELVYGYDGFAGEIGHTCAKNNGRLCGCGQRGCLETYVSIQGIKRTVFELLVDYNGGSSLSKYSFDELTPEMIYKAASDGDKIALEAFRITGEILGIQLADSVAYFSPEKIFIFGSLARSGDFILKPTRESFEKNLFKIFKGKISIELSSLECSVYTVLAKTINSIPIELSSIAEGNVGMLGASALIWQELKD